MTAISEFQASEEAARILDRLDPHRQRQVLAFVAARYGYSLQPSPKRTMAMHSPSNRGEFAAVEEISDLWDGLTPAQHKQAMATLAARFEAATVAAYKPPSKGYAPRHKRPPSG